MSIENLGDTIRKERLRQGMTQEQLAEKADISLNFMSLIENGKNMSVQTLVSIAKALDVNIDSLVYSELHTESDRIAEQILLSLSTMTDDEKLFILSIIKQYKSLNQ